MQEYADPVIDWLDAGRGILPHRFFRDVRYFPLNSHCIVCSPPNLFHLLIIVLYPTAKRLIHKRLVSS